NPPTAPYGTVYTFPANLQLPFTWQTNLSLEQAIGKSQALKVSYVGAFARKLLQQREIENLQTINPAFTTVIITQNGGTSDYNSFQLQYQRRLSNGLQALASYTLSRCLDSGSQNNALPYQRGNCDFDVRHSLSGALSYDGPKHFKGGALKVLLNDWGM